MGKKAPSPPPPIDVEAAITRQAEENRFNFISPIGNIELGEIEGGQFSPTGGLAQRITLSPEVEAALTSEQRLDALLSNQAIDLTGRLPTEAFDTANLNSPDFPGGIDFSALTPLPSSEDLLTASQPVEEATQSRLTNLLNPQFELDERRARQRLADQGLPQGGEAFETELDNLFRRRDESLLQVADQSVLAGRAEQSRLQSAALQVRTQELGERLTEIGLTKEEINFLQSQELLNRGTAFNELASLAPLVSPVQLPQFQPQSQIDTFAPLALNAAQQNQVFQAEQQQNLGLLNGLFSLGGAGITGATFGLFKP